MPERLFVDYNRLKWEMSWQGCPTLVPAYYLKMYTLAVHPLVLSRTMSVQFPAAFTVKTLAVFKGPFGTSVEVPGPIKVCVILEPGGELCEFTN